MGAATPPRATRSLVLRGRLFPSSSSGTKNLIYDSQIQTAHWGPYLSQRPKFWRVSSSLASGSCNSCAGL
nr:hypothetical protein [uncultured bacterium]